MLQIRYRHTSCYFLESAKSDALLALDAGWPCTLWDYCRAMKDAGLDFKRVRYAAVTHFHMDHAGLLGEFLRKGIVCFAFPGQFEGIAEMERIILKNREYARYVHIARDQVQCVDYGGFAAFMSGVGIDCQVLATDGHSRDSVSFLTPEGEAFIGDLYPLSQVMPDDAASLRSWSLLKDRGATICYPSHAQRFDLL